MKLEQLRAKIDRIDEKILALLNQRAKEAAKISKVKKGKKLTTYSPERESSLFRHLKKINKGPFKAEDVENVFREILSVCRAQRTTLSVAYLGPQGTFTYSAAVKKFGKKPKYISSVTIAEVFERVEKNEADYGVIPIENSTEGVINHTLDMFLVSDLQICAEVILDISHFLIGNSFKDIKRIYSNSQVFPQCRQWLSKNLPMADFIPVSSTASAALEVQKDLKGACIGNKELANIYGLNILSSGIEDSSCNCTRFLVISKNGSLVSGKDKTSVLFSVKDKVGALYDVLSYFKSSGANLTKIESRPSKRKPWEYYFFVDVEGHKSSSLVQKALEKLESKCIFVKVLGSYPREN